MFIVNIDVVVFSYETSFCKRLGLSWGRARQVPLLLLLLWSAVVRCSDVPKSGKWWELRLAYTDWCDWGTCLTSCDWGTCLTSCDWGTCLTSCDWGTCLTSCDWGTCLTSCVLWGGGSSSSPAVNTYMKNWEPFVSFPRFAMERRNSLSCRNLKFSSEKWQKRHILHVQLQVCHGKEEFLVRSNFKMFGKVANSEYIHVQLQFAHRKEPKSDKYGKFCTFNWNFVTERRNSLSCLNFLVMSQVTNN